MSPRHLFRALCATGAVIGGILAVLNASAYAAGESTTALTSPTSELHQADGQGLPGLAAGFCDPGMTTDVELASQQYTLLPEGQGVTGHISVTFGCTPAELPRTGSTG
jgi:hypothetical protein